MPTTLKVDSLIFKDLTYSKAPASVEEFNSLDPKALAEGRNRCLECAVDDRMKHSVLGSFRDEVLEFIEEKYSIERKNNGTEKNPKWERDMDFMNRVVATVLQQRDLDPTKAENVAVVEKELRDDAQRILDGIDFPVAGREGGSGGGAPIGKRDMAFAEEAIKSGKAEKLAGLLSAALGRAVDFSDVKPLAAAIRDNRQKMAKELEEQQRALLG